MLLGFAIFAGSLAAVFGVIALHECGHFLAGIAAGIPAAQMKIRLFTFPQHVALRDGATWLSPVRDYHRYAERSLMLTKGKRGGIAYVAGGLVAQTIVVVLFVLVWRALGFSQLWLFPLTLALVAVPPLYFFADLVFTRIARRPCGDFSVLWQLSPVASVIVTGITIAGHLAVLACVWPGR
jgi:hypothetical protein